MASDEADSTKKRRSRKRRALSMGRVLSLLAFLPALCRWLLRPTEKDNWKPDV